MVDALKTITSFFVMLKENTYVLIRIESLVALVTVMFFVMFILDIYRCRSRSSILTTILESVDSLSDHIVLYLLGAMQSVCFENQMFPVWAIVLVSLRANLGYLSGYGISARERRFTEVGNVIKFLGAGILNGTRELEFTKPLWSLWAILQLRCIYRCYAHHRAITSLWHGRSSEFLPQYMQAETCDSEQGNEAASTSQQDNYDLACDHAKNNRRYLVYGESSQKMNLKRPGYTLNLEVIHPESLITLDKITECTKPLLSSDDDHKYKDISLAFTLSRLLRCRLEDVPLHKESLLSTKNLIKSIISVNKQMTSTALTLGEMAAEAEAAVETASMTETEATVPVVVMEAATPLVMVTEVVMEITSVVKEDAAEARATIETAVVLGPETPSAQVVAAEKMAIGGKAYLEEATLAAAETTIMVKAKTPQEVIVGAVTEAPAEATPVLEVEASTVAAVVPQTASVETRATASAQCAFKILELELAFVRDYFYTLYPIVFWKGISSLCLSLLLSMATFAVTVWLAVAIHKVYREVPKDNFMLQMHGGNVDVLITWLFMIFMMFKEVWEIITYLLSNWTRLLLVCKYVKSQLWFKKIVVTEDLVSSFFVSNIADPWYGHIDQYDFLRSLTYKPSFWKVANAITLGKTPQKFDGRKSGNAIKIPECVKPAILQALHRIGLDNPQLPREIPSLNGSVEQFARYSWACLDLDTCSQVILVWHIATSLCEIKLAQECEIDLANSGFLSSAWSCLKTFSCCASNPYLVNENNRLTGELKTDYHTATSLSRYCAYLLVFRPELLPDSFVMPDLIFEETLEDAREQLGGCNLILYMYDKLITIAQEAEENNHEAPVKKREAMGNNQEVTQKDVGKRLRMNIVQQGATLGKDLICMNQKTRWKILAGVWADLLVHIAPSWNAVGHKSNLESGGEFITLIWALLWHCGIEKSKLWESDEVSESTPQVHQENNNGTRTIQPLGEQQASESNAQVPLQKTDTANQTQREGEVINSISLNSSD